MNITAFYIVYVAIGIGGLVMFFAPEKISQNSDNYTLLRVCGLLICAAVTDFSFGSGYFGIFLMTALILYGFWFMFKGVRDE
jgi:Ca2+/Na+ antiporter